MRVQYQLHYKVEPGITIKCALVIAMNVLFYSTAAKIAALEAKLHQMDEETILAPSTHQYYSQERVRRRHGGNIKIKHPQKVCQKPYDRTDVLLRRI